MVGYWAFFNYSTKCQAALASSQTQALTTLSLDALSLEALSLEVLICVSHAAARGLTRAKFKTQVLATPMLLCAAPRPRRKGRITHGTHSAWKIESGARAADLEFHVCADREHDKIIARSRNGGLLLVYLPRNPDVCYYFCRSKGCQRSIGAATRPGKSSTSRQNNTSGRRSI